MDAADYDALESEEFVIYGGEIVSHEDLKARLIANPPYPYKKGFENYIDADELDKLASTHFDTHGLRPNDNFYIEDVKRFKTKSGDEVVAYAWTEEY